MRACIDGTTRARIVMQSIAQELAEAGMLVGAQVQVIATDIKFYHVPKAKGKAVDPCGVKGVIVDTICHEQLTPNRPILVQISVDQNGEPFTKPFKAHFELDELRLCEASGEDNATISPGSEALANGSSKPMSIAAAVGVSGISTATASSAAAPADDWRPTAA